MASAKGGLTTRLCAVNARKEKRADLHLHTCHSDGTFSPREVVQKAIGLQLSAISVTYHDTVEGLKEAFSASGEGLEVIPGVELTAVFKEREIHILGYGFRPQDTDLTAFLKRMQQYRKARIQAMIDRLKMHKVHVTLEEVSAAAGEGSLGRPHLAQVLVEKGFVRSLDEAFQRYLGDKAPCFVKGATLTVPEAVRLIGKAGGVAVLAHPKWAVFDEWIPELVSAGIQGIEVYHSDHSPGIAEKYRRIASTHNLLITGGSDCHGLRKTKGPLMGTVTIPYELVERLKAATLTAG